jgi:hypothetical protein
MLSSNGHSYHMCCALSQPCAVLFLLADSCFKVKLAEPAKWAGCWLLLLLLLLLPEQMAFH